MAHWFSQDDIIDTYSMLKGFDQAGLGLHENDYFSRAFPDGPNNGVPLSCAGMLTERNGEGPNYLADEKIVKEVTRDEYTFFNKKIWEMGLADDAPAVSKSYAVDHAMKIIESAKIPMEKYVSPDPKFNALFKACPEMIVLTDVLSYYEDRARWEFRPFGNLEEKTPLQIRGIYPEMLEDFKETCKGNRILRGSSFYGVLDADSMPIFWIKPVIETPENGGTGNIDFRTHWLYSPGSNGSKFLSLDIIQLSDLGPESPNPRTIYLMQAENIDPRLPETVAHC